MSVALSCTSSESVTADDVVADVWKKSKEISAETLHDVESVWYGFYNQRDVEIRIYESDEVGMNSSTGEGAGFLLLE